MRNWFLIFTLCVSQICHSASAQNSVEKTLSVADDLMNVGRISLAVKVLQLSPDSENEAVLVKLLTCLIDGAYFNQAISVAEKSKDVGSKSFQSKLLTYLGTAYQLKGENDKALDAFSEAIKLDTNFPAEVARREILDEVENVSEEVRKSRPLVLSGDRYVETLRTSLNLIHMQHANGLMAYEMNPSDKRIKEQGVALEVKGEFKSAIDLYNKEIDSGKPEIELWNSLGLCALTECTLNENSLPYFYIADNAFAKALAINKDDWRILNNVAILKSLDVPEPPKTYLSTTPALKNALKFVAHCDAASHNERVRAGRALSMYAIIEMLKDKYPESKFNTNLLKQPTAPSSPSPVPSP